MKSEYSLINNVPEYIDVNIYITLDSGEQYLARLYKDTMKGVLSGPNYRHAKDGTSEFREQLREEDIPAEVASEMLRLLPEVSKLILDEEKRRLGESHPLVILDAKVKKLVTTAENLCASIECEPIEIGRENRLAALQEVRAAIDDLK
jgi:hypothetical protein